MAAGRPGGEDRNVFPGEQVPEPVPGLQEMPLSPVAQQSTITCRSPAGYRLCPAPRSAAATQVPHSCLAQRSPVRDPSPRSPSGSRSENRVHQPSSKILAAEELHWVPVPEATVCGHAFIVPPARSPGPSCRFLTADPHCGPHSLRYPQNVAVPPLH